MLLLLETPAGFALFKVLDEERLPPIQDLAELFESAESAREIVKLEAFLKFVSTAEALKPATSLIKSKRHEGLGRFLKAHCDEGTLGVADSKLCHAIKSSTEINCVHNGVVEELIRGVQARLTDLISGLPDQVDTMIIQAIGVFDDRDNELNSHAKRLRGWYGCHFPEFDKIVQDIVCYAKTVKLMGGRSNAAKLDFSEILPEVSENELKKAALISTGTEISELDIINIREICDRILSLSVCVSQLRDYLKKIMNTAAPNLTALVGELVGARLIAHAGSMMNLGKKPGSKIQILGGGKHRLIYHAPLISQAPQEMKKGKIARSLAAKAALAIRVDVCGKYEDNSFGVNNLAKVEALLGNAAKGGGQGDNKSAKGKRVTRRGAVTKTFNPSGPASSDAANVEEHVTQAAKAEKEKKNGQEKEEENVEVTRAPVHGNVSADGKEAGAGEKKKKKKKKRVAEHDVEETEQPERKKKKEEEEA